MQQLKKLYEKTKQSLLLTHKNNPDAGIEILKQVQSKIKILKEQNPQLIKQIVSLEVISLNNLACAYNKKGKYRASLYHLHTASQLEREVFTDVDHCGDPEALHQVATTHSNLCAVLSQMGDHEKSYREIYRAIQLLLKTEQTSKSDALAVFYFNCAVELEYLNRLNEAQKMAEKGYSLSISTKKEMEHKFSELLTNLEQKIKKREKKVAKMMLDSIKMRNKSITDEKSIAKRGNSLNLISQYAPDNLEHSGFRSEVSKQFSAYYTRMPKLASRTIKPNEYPMVRLPSFTQNTKKLGYALGLQQRKKVISLYSPEKRQKRIPRNQRLSLKRREDTLQKIVSEQIIK